MRAWLALITAVCCFSAPLIAEAQPTPDRPPPREGNGPFTRQPDPPREGGISGMDRVMGTVYGLGSAAAGVAGIGWGASVFVGAAAVTFLPAVAAVAGIVAGVGALAYGGYMLWNAWKPASWGTPVVSTEPPPPGGFNGNRDTDTRPVPPGRGPFNPNGGRNTVGHRAPAGAPR